MLLLDAWSHLDHGLTALQPLWRPQPFRLVTSPSAARKHPLHDAALELTDEAFERLSGGSGTGGEDLLHDWMHDALAQHDGDAARSFGAVQDVLDQFPSRAADLGSSSQPSYSGRTQPREASGVPGRKWEQVEAFARLVPPGKTLPIVDWCSGKGHLARWLHATSGCGCPIHCLEIDEKLCNSGRMLTQKQRRISPDAITFYQHNVLMDTLPPNLRGSEYTYTALHACGELHRTALLTAVKEQAQTIVVVPCCYEKQGIGGAGAGPVAKVQPLSTTARSRTSLTLTRDDLFLAVADGVVTANAKEAKVREREQAWRLAFDLWRRDQKTVDWDEEARASVVESDAAFASSVASDHLTVPSASYRLLAENDFTSFMRHCVTANGSNAIARRRLEPALVEALSSRPKLLEAYAGRGEELRRQVGRLELVRRAFQRPFEMWLIIDYALFLEENGYEVEVRQLCDRVVTPRNVALVAQRAVL